MYGRYALACAIILASSLCPPRVWAAGVAFDNDCDNLLWFDSCQGKTNWDNDGLPMPGDDVTIGDLFQVRAGSGNGTLEIQVKSLVVGGGFVLGGVNLAVAEASAIKGLDLGARITSARAEALGAGVVFSGDWTWRIGGILRGAPARARFRNTGNLSLVARPGIIDNAILDNQGTITHTGWLSLKPTAELQNRNLWVLTTNNDDIARADPNSDPDTARFYNFGILRNTGGSSNIDVVFDLIAPGQVEVTGGDLTFKRPSFFGGSLSVGQGAQLFIEAPAGLAQTYRQTVTLSGAGTATLKGAQSHSHRIEGILKNELTPAPGGLVVAGEVFVSQDGSLRNDGSLFWRGPVRGTGSFVHAAGAMVIDSAAARLGAPLQVRAAVMQTDNLTVETANFANGDAAIIDSGGMWTIQRSEILTVDPALRGRMVVFGRLLTTGTGPRSRVEIPVDPRQGGSIRVELGATLALFGGGVWSSPAPLDIVGKLELSAPAASQPRIYKNIVESRLGNSIGIAPGSLFLRANATLQVDKRLITPLQEGFFVSGGTVAGPGPLENSGLLVVESGRLGNAGAGRTVVTNRNFGTMRLAGNPLPLNGTITNGFDGVLHLSEGLGLVLEDEALVESFGTCELRGSMMVTGSGDLRNYGLLTKTTFDGTGAGQGGVSTISLPFDNQGTVIVVAGILQLSGIVRQVEGEQLNGGTWIVRRGARVNFAGPTLRSIGPGANVTVVTNATSGGLEAIRRVEGSLGVVDEFTSGSLQVAPGGSCLTLLNEADGRSRGRSEVAAVAPQGGEAPAGRFALSGGEFLNEGTILPGGEGALAPFMIDGSYRQTATGTLHIDVNAAADGSSTVSDRLVVSGVATLAGILRVDLLDGHRPAAGEVITVLSAASVDGRFANPGDRVQTDLGAFRIIYNATSVELADFDPSALPTITAATPTATPHPSASTSPGVSTATPSPTPTDVLSSGCIGDCNGDSRVAVNELITGVGIALQRTELEVCRSFDRDRNGLVAISELIAAVNASLRGCPED